MLRNRLVTLVVAGCVLTGCKTVRNNVAVTEEYLRAQRPTFLDFDRTKNAVFVTRQGSEVRVQCLQNRFGYKKDDKAHPKRPDDECLYLSVAMAGIPTKASVDPGERDDVVGILTAVSDMNCRSYLFRVFASKAGLDTGRSVLKDLSTAAAASTAPFAPYVASGLGVGNLLVGTTVDNINSTYYLEKTFQAMESAIAEERLKLRRQLYEKRGKTIVEYPFMDAWNDVHAYADACSLQRGLARLVEITGEKKADAAESLQAAVDPTHSTTARISELQQQLARLQATAEVAQSKVIANTAQQELNQTSLETTTAALVDAGKAKDAQIELLNATIRNLQSRVVPGVEGGATANPDPPKP
jgi:hypothetical protein